MWRFLSVLVTFVSLILSSEISRLACVGVWFISWTYDSLLLKSKRDQRSRAPNTHNSCLSCTSLLYPYCTSVVLSRYGCPALKPFKVYMSGATTQHTRSFSSFGWRKDNFSIAVLYCRSSHVHWHWSPRR